MPDAAFDPAVARLIDANFNRAREAIRVLEDAARFILDDAPLTERAKGLRHDLTAAVRSLPQADRMIVFRDTPADVGTAITHDAEQHRAGTLTVVDAAAGRLTEALRALAEYGKLLDPAVAERIEQIRYAAYDLHKALTLRLRPKATWQRVRLYVLITEELCSGDWLEVARAAIEGGADCLQLREKHLSDAELLRRARKLADLCHAHGVLCIVNDRPDIARLAGADGVHLGQDDLPVREARKVVGPDAIIGKSTHNLDQALAAAAESPDYIAVGPMFASATKPQEHIAGPATLGEVTEKLNLPVVAIGGITPENLEQVLQAGAKCVAVCQAVIAQPDPAAAAAAFKEKLI